MKALQNFPWRHRLVIAVVLLPVATWLYLRDRVWGRWMRRFPRTTPWSVTWYDEDGQTYTTMEHIALMEALPEGEVTWRKRRFHWRTRWPDGQMVSTVFLGLDHAWSGAHAVLWETCVFGAHGVGSDVVRRYTRRFDAAVGHIKIVAVVQFYRLKAALRREPRLTQPIREEEA